MVRIPFMCSWQLYMTYLAAGAFRCWRCQTAYSSSQLGRAICRMLYKACGDAAHWCGANTTLRGLWGCYEYQKKKLRFRRDSPPMQHLISIFHPKARHTTPSMLGRKERKQTSSSSRSVMPTTMAIGCDRSCANFVFYGRDCHAIKTVYARAPPALGGAAVQPHLAAFLFSFSRRGCKAG